MMCLFLVVLPISYGSYIISVNNTKSPEIEWNKTFYYDNSGGRVRQVSDNGYIIVGGRNRFNDIDILFTKIDSNGIFQWNKSLGVSASDVAYSVRETLDGGYILASHRFSEGVGGFRLIKADSVGDGDSTDTSTISNPRF